MLKNNILGALLVASAVVSQGWIQVLPVGGADATLAARAFRWHGMRQDIV